MNAGIADHVVRTARRMQLKSGFHLICCVYETDYKLPNIADRTFAIPLILYSFSVFRSNPGPFVEDPAYFGAES